MKDFCEALLQNELKDVLVSGYIEKEAVQKFNPLYDRLYFVFDQVIFELIANSCWNIKARSIQKIAPWFDVDEDDAFGISSIYTQCFKTEFPAQIVSTSCYVENATSETLFFQAAYAIGEKKSAIFINPKNTFGFSFSDNTDEEISWLSETAAAGISVCRELMPLNATGRKNE